MKIRGLSADIYQALTMISEKTGIVNSFRRGHGINGDPRIVAYSASTAHVGRFTDGFSQLAGGAGASWHQALLATLGEAAERYGSAFYRIEDLPRRRAKDFPKDDIIPPERFALFAKEQYESEGFPFVPFTEDVELYWDKTIDLTDGKEKYIPAVFIYMPFRAEKNLIAEQISTGFACHFDPYRALLSAIFEVIERDSFMISWANLLDLPKLRLSGKSAEFVEKLVPSHFEVHFLDMTTDIGVPAVLGMLKGKTDVGEILTVAASCRFTYHEAIQKTCIELCQSVPYVRALMETEREYKEFSDLRTFVDHSLFYIYNKNLATVFDPWLNKRPDKPLPVEEELAPEEQIRRILRRFRDLGYPVLVKDKTTCDLAEIGLTLVRVVCPDLVHLNGTYGQYYFGGRRLREVPERLGYSVKNTYETFNKMPHPFP